MAAPKGNKYALGNDGGRPPVYSSVEELKLAIDKYFNEDHKIRTVLIGKAPNQTKVELPVITITGLTMYLGFESRQSFYDYEKNEEFSYIIKRARLFVENEYEEQLQHGNTTGAIFALKNMGWIDKQELDHTTNGQSINQVTKISFKDTSTKESDI